MSAFRSTRYVRFHSQPVVVGAVGKWESRGVCGISKRGGKVGFMTFPARGFSTARRAVIFSAAGYHAIFLQRPASGHSRAISIGHFMDQRHGRYSGLDPGAHLGVPLPPRVIRVGRGRLLFLGRGLPRSYGLRWNWAWNLLPTHRPIAIANL